MVIDLSRTLVVGVSSRALFDLEYENKIYESQGFPLFSEHQRSHEPTVLKRGTAFPLVEALLRLNTNDSERKVEVVLMSRNHPDAALRVFNSITHYGLDVTRAALTGGTPVARYLDSFKVDLFLSAFDEDVQAAANEGFAAGKIYGVPETSAAAIDHIRVAFDGDCVLFSNEAQQIFDTAGIGAFREHERTNAQRPLPPGPFAKLIKTLAAIQGPDLEHSPVQIALVTSRDAPAHERAIRTMRVWGVRLDQAFFLGGLPKEGVLEAFQPHIFFDDQALYCEAAAPYVPTAQVLPQSVTDEMQVEAVDITVSAAANKEGFLMVCKKYLKRDFNSKQSQLEDWHTEQVSVLDDPHRRNFLAELAQSIEGSPKGEERRAAGPEDSRSVKLFKFLEQLLDKHSRKQLDP